MDPRELLRRLMAAEGLNPNSLAARTGGKTRQPQIHRFLTGEAKEPRRSTLEPVAKVFRVPVDAFFDTAVATSVWAEREDGHGHVAAYTSAPPQTGGLVAHQMGDLAPTIEPITIVWEQIKVGNVPDAFVLAMPDDALAPDTPKGCRLIFHRGQPENFGAGVLVEDAKGNRYVRRYLEGSNGTWRAHARNDAYLSLQSDVDGLSILAHVVWRADSQV